MLSSKRSFTKRGFTLIEVLVAVAILGLVAAGSLRLMIISTNSLAEVREAREILNFARETQLEFMTKETKPESGADGKFRWNTRRNSWEILGGLWTIVYNQLTIESDKNKVILYLSIY